VIAGLSPTIFRTWGASISDYCDLGNQEELARRWLGTRQRALAHRSSFGRPFPWAKEAQQLFVGLIEEATNSEDGIAQVETYTFYSFGNGLGATRNSSSGNQILTGAGWSGPSVRSGPIGDRSAFLEFCAEDLLAKDMCFACPVGTTPGAVVNVRVEAFEGPVLSEYAWTAPPSGKGWIVGGYPTKANEGEVTPVRISFCATSESDGTERSGAVTVGGILVFPRDLDRYWFEFLENQSEGLLPSQSALERREH
jgi:hypothetical protein